MGSAFTRVPLEVVRRKAARLTIAAVRCRDKMRDGGWGDELWTQLGSTWLGLGWAGARLGWGSARLGSAGTAEDQCLCRDR